MYKTGASVEEIICLQNLYQVQGVYKLIINLFKTHSNKEKIPCLRLNNSTHSVELWKNNWQR